MAPALVPVQGIARHGVAEEDILAANNAGNAYLTLTLAQSDLHGAGHLGVAPLDRIIMSLRSGIASETEHALSTLTFYSCNDPKLVDLAAYPIIGTELVSFFAKPYHMLQAGTAVAQIPTPVLLASVEALLSLRNAVQDLHNQQWLCQMPHFRKNAVEALKFLNSWFYTATAPKLYALERASDVFRESLKHLLDVLDPVTCFYVENARNDPLFHQLLVVLAHTNDKHALVVVLKCLQHLLFLGGADGVRSRDQSEPDTNNCIDAVLPQHLSTIVRCLLVHDDELHFAVLLFLKQYLASEALHAQYKQSVRHLQLHRLRKLVNAEGNLDILAKQLPELIVARLPLVDPAQVPETVPLQLKKNSTYSGVPAVTPKLPAKLYDIILTFPEPLRATTWLRCCYEPLSIPKGESDLTAGEVTQISLWKSYENQFEAIWKDRFNPKWPNLLPAVDFIKNVSLAFPNSEAMVVNVPLADPTQQPRKKFIIKGIQPRQFPVSIDIGTFEALRKNNRAPEEKSVTAAEVGDVDTTSFKENMNAFVDSILSASEGLTEPQDTSAPWYSPINLLSKEIFENFAASLLESDSEGKYRAAFRLYNKEWLPNLVFANPGLVEHGYIDGKWLQYLL